MGLFKKNRKPDETDLATLLGQGTDMIEQLAKAHSDSWGLGSADRWDLDQRTGVITWTFPDKTASAPAQLLGSHNPSAGSWLWAWANESILPELSRDSRVVRDWALAHGHDGIAEAKVEADEELAATLAALAVRITRATGFYRDAQATSIPIITFGPVTLTAADGTTSTFEISVG